MPRRAAYSASPSRAFLVNDARNARCPPGRRRAMLPGMDDDLEALALLRADICKLFLPGPVRERWLAWAELVCSSKDAFISAPTTYNPCQLAGQPCRQNTRSRYS